MDITPVDLRDIDKRAENVYEAISVAALKARQINTCLLYTSKTFETGEIKNIIF